MQKAQDSAQPRILVGTSGFAYKEWKGTFYPEDLPAKKYLSFYAEHFPTTEINNTFYRMPTTKLTEGWYVEVPDGFSFTLKLSQRITHFKRLKNVDEEMEFFLTSAAALKEKLGPILVQLPPNFKKDLGVLDEFLAKFASRGRLAFEFRHDSWFDDDVFELLRKHKAAFGVVEKEDDGKGADAPREVTGPFVYMRLRKGEYSGEEMIEWARWIRSQTVPVYCYLKHDDLAPTLAKNLLKSLAEL
ncbi:MAG TPA: DUF72 domain-containing protein [Blastocatellia bacterium]|nr:DUF72 domain-containing protein [Blastocatellia bacterium]